MDVTPEHDIPLDATGRDADSHFQQRDTEPGHPAGALVHAAVASGTLAALLGLLGLVGWMSGRHVLASVRADFIPMAPLSAICFLLGASTLIGLASAATSRPGKAWMATASTLLQVLCAVKILEFRTAGKTGIEALLVRAPGLFGVVPSGRISPLTVAGFVLVGVAAILLMSKRTKLMIDAAASLAAAVALGSSVVMVGYLYQTPLLYGAAIIPMALPTAIGLLCLGVGTVAAAGPKSCILRPFAGPSARARLLRAFVPLTVGVVVAGGFLQSALPLHFHLNEALSSALTALVSATVAGAIASRTARTIGGAIDRAESDRNRAEGELRESQSQLRRQFERVTALRAID